MANRSYLPATPLPQVGRLKASLETDAIVAALVVVGLVLYIHHIPQNVVKAIFGAKQQDPVPRTPTDGNTNPIAPTPPANANEAPCSWNPIQNNQRWCGGDIFNPSAGVKPVTPSATAPNGTMPGNAPVPFFGGSFSGQNGAIPTTCYANPVTCVLPSVTVSPPNGNGNRVCLATCDCAPRQGETAPSYCGGGVG